MARTSARKSITPQEHAQLLGLRLLADKFNLLLKELEEAALLITEERDHDGNLEKVYGGSLTADCIYGSREVGELLDLLNVKVVRSKRLGRG